MPTDLLISALTTLIVAIDPVGLAPIFVGLTSDLSAERRRQIAVIATLIAFAILAFFTVLGEAFLATLGIGIPAFRIAGGLLLFYVAFEMVFELRDQRKKTAADIATEDDSDHAHNIAAFPLAIPLMAGPGAITACILLSARLSPEPNGLAILVGLIAAVCAMCLVSFLAAGIITRILGNLGRLVLTRLLGVILAALAIQFIVDGVRGFLPA